MNAIVVEWIVHVWSCNNFNNSHQSRAAEKLTIYECYRLDPSVDAVPSKGQAADDHT